MPRIEFDGRVIECAQGENLRSVLRRAGAGRALYNGASRAIHCRGLGTCGTCAVRIEGDVSPPTAVERWRLDFPPHDAERDLRLACQCRVEGDLRLTKFEGLWGHRGAPKRNAASSDEPSRPTRDGLP